jgi:trehalose-phosphatase
VKKYLFDCFEEIINKIRNADHILLCLDYDGTLVPICSKPSLAKLSFETKNLLTCLSQNPYIFISIISGRSLDEIRKLIGVENILYAGNHGFEVSYKENYWVHPEAKKIKPFLKNVVKELKAQLNTVDGVLIEDKGLTLSVHYRNIVGESKDIKKIIYNIITPYSKMLKITLGKKVYEIRPKIDWDKGKVITKIQQVFNMKEMLKIYIGDDKTDEDAFKILKQNDISIVVGYKKYSKAHYFCKSSKEVILFLRHLKSLY